MRQPNSLRARLSRLLAVARASITWERLWPAMAPSLGVLLLFMASAWMGFWIGVAPMVKVAGLLVFAALFVVALLPLRRFVLPDENEAMRRLEDEASLEHRPLAAYSDTLVSGDDPVSRGLWRVHRQRAEARLSALRTPVPRADLVPHDPYALRSLVGLVAFVGVLVGAGALAERLLTPFDFSHPAGTATVAQFRMDAWVTPPSYTGRSPLFLSSATRVETGDGIRVPAGSVLTVRTQGRSGMDLYVSAQSGSAPVPMVEIDAPGGEGAPAAFEGTVTIGESMVVELRQSGATINGWRFMADGDEAPNVRLLDAPKRNERDGFEVAYELGDDYGIANAEGILAPDGADADREPLVENPAFALTLPGGAGMRGASRTMQDLSSHPYAGLEMELTLRAVDGAGQEGFSEPHTFRVPAKGFGNPIARAIVEQRTALALDARVHPVVIDTFDLLLLAVEDQSNDRGARAGAGAYLAMRGAYRDLVAAETHEELTAMLDSLWELALLLENDLMSDAERALAAAQERLRQALEDGASEEEIARLTEELRQAMQDYMRALAQQMQNNPNQQQAMDPNAQTLTQQNLDDMLKRIEELARQGRHDEAEALLSELQQMMQNLQMAQQGQQGQQGDPMGQEGRTLDELGRMIQRQQELMDETYGLQQEQQRQQQQGQGQQGQQGQQQFGQNGQGQMGPLGRMPPGQRGQGQQPGQRGQPRPGEGMNPSELADALRRLQEEQQALQRQLDEMMRGLEDQGFDPGERLGDAEDSMGRAGENLAGQRPGAAAGDQDEALQALREGAQSLAQQLAEAMEPGEGQGQAMGSPDGGPQRDPLGRASREGTVADTSRVGIPDEIEAQQARRILEELRRRLSDGLLPRMERDYLERLLP